MALSNSNNQLHFLINTQSMSIKGTTVNSLQPKYTLYIISTLKVHLRPDMNVTCVSHYCNACSNDVALGMLLSYSSN